MSRTRRTFRNMLRVKGIIHLLLLLTIVCTVFVKYVWDKNVDLLIVVEVLFVITGLIIEPIALSLYKEWEVKEARFGFMGAFVRATFGMVVIFGVIYILVQYLPVPG
ncbi:hypothetical protein [Planifilum fimeticola]